MESRIIFLLVIVTCLFHDASSGNILAIYPTPSYSHQVVFLAHAKAMLARGHHITLITTDPIDSNNPNLTQIDFHSFYDDFRSSLNFVEHKEKGNDIFSLWEWFMSYIETSTEKAFQLPEIQKLIKNEGNQTFDVVIIEALNYLSWYAFGAKYNAPIIEFTSLDTLSDNHQLRGNVINPIVHPDISVHSLPPLDFYMRWQSLKLFIYNKLFYRQQYNDIYTRLVRKFMPDIMTTAEEVRKLSQLLMTNTHPVLGYVRPIVPTTIQLGFMHLEDPKPLPDDLQKFLDSSKRGVIYMSLGSNVRSADLSAETRLVFLNAFRALSDHDVLWKWETDSMESQPENVRISKWLPQRDLLAHPNIKCFIMQGGQQSMEEAIARTVPLVVIPFIGDQPMNAQRIVRKNVGISLDIATLTSTKLEETIREVMKPKYKKNMEELRDVIFDQPMSSMEKAVWWTEYVMRHKTTKHLEYIGTKIPMYQQLYLDFIAIALALVTAFIFICHVVFKIIWGKFPNVSTKSKAE